MRTTGGLHGHYAVPVYYEFFLLCYLHCRTLLLPLVLRSYSCCHIPLFSSASSGTSGRHSLVGGALDPGRPLVQSAERQTVKVFVMNSSPEKGECKFSINLMRITRKSPQICLQLYLIYSIRDSLLLE